MSSYDIAEEIADMTVRMESGDWPTENENYQLLLLAMMEIRRLSHRVRVLEDINKGIEM